ncbi:MAG: DUF6472 family protein [Clostridia bacterium]|nr:DUF6472 family protein [Clostridia bacterium]
MKDKAEETACECDKMTSEETKPKRKESGTFTGSNDGMQAIAEKAPRKPKEVPAETKKKKPATRCEDCEFYDIDEFTGDMTCSVSLDEDEFAEFMAGRSGRCPYYRYYDEYKSVRKQN